jgi:hypothetical protein
MPTLLLGRDRLAHTELAALAVSAKNWTRLLLAAMMIACGSGSTLRDNQSIDQPAPALTSEGGSGTDIGAAAANAPSCKVELVSQRRLAVDSATLLQIQPLIVEASSNGDILIGGLFTHLFRKSEDGTWTFVEQDSIFGAIIAADGAVRIVKSPISRRLMDAPTAVANPDGTWAILFAEVADYEGPFRPSFADKLWFSTLSGTEWGKRELIPTPPGVNLPTSAGSALIRSDRAVAWALSLRLDGILVFEKQHGGAWSHEIVPIVGGAVHPQLSYSDTDVLFMAVVYAEPRPGQATEGSLFLWSRSPVWKLDRKIADYEDGRVSDPVIRLSPSPQLLAWKAGEMREGGVIRAIFGRITEGNDSTTILNRSARFTGPIQFVDGPDSSALWMLDPQPRSGLSSPEIRLLQQTKSGMVIPTSFPNPFVAPFGATFANNEVTVVGGIHDPIESIVFSLIMHFRLVC